MGRLDYFIPTLSPLPGKAKSQFVSDLESGVSALTQAARNAKEYVSPQKTISPISEPLQRPSQLQQDIGWLKEKASQAPIQSTPIPSMLASVKQQAVDLTNRKNKSLDAMFIQPTTPTPTPFTPTPRVIPEPTPIPGFGSKTQNENTDLFIKNVVSPLATKYGIHPSIAAGQFAREGRLGGIGASLNNFYNLGITDAMVESGDYSNAPRFNTPEEGVEAYFRFITGQANDGFYANGVDGSKEGKIGKKQFQEAFAQYKDNPELFLETIGPAYSSTGSAYLKDVTATPEWRYYAE